MRGGLWGTWKGVMKLLMGCRKFKWSAIPGRLTAVFYRIDLSMESA
jgi:hypothetical protein